MNNPCTPTLATSLVTAQLLTSIGDHLSESLEQLDISGSSGSIGFSGLQTLLVKCNRLRLLDISSHASVAAAVDDETDYESSDDGLTYARLMQLRRSFPACTLISSHPCWPYYSGYRGNRVDEEQEDGQDEHEQEVSDRQYYLFGDPGDHDNNVVNEEGQPALPGIGQLLALPAPSDQMMGVDVAALQVD